MVSLPPPDWAELFYSGAWNTITGDLRATSAVTITRGLTSESSSAAEPTACSCDLDSRNDQYAPRNPTSPLYNLIGRNTPFRFGYDVGSPWAEFDGGLDYNSLFVNDNPALDITGDFDLRLDLALEDWSESQMLALRYVPSANDCWALEILNGTPTFLWSPDGTFASRITQAATEPVRGYNGQRMALRVTLDINNGAGGYELRFYTGRTVNDTEWHLLGAPIVGAATTSVFAGTAYMEFGAGFSFNSDPAGGSLNRMRGKAYALKLLDSGTVKVDMSTQAATVGGTTFVDATGLTWSLGGNAFFTNRHVRMAGEVPAWPPTRDLSGNDNYVSINPTGITRRMDAGNKPQDSALRRYIKALDPVDCWPLTDGVEAPAAKSLNGGTDLQQVIDPTLDTAAEWSAGTLADWIEPVILVKEGTTGSIEGSVRHPASTDASWSVDFFVNGGGQTAAGTFRIYDRGAGTDDDNMNWFQMVFNGNAGDLPILFNSVASNSSSTLQLSDVDNVGIYTDRPHHVRLTVDPQTTSTLWYLYIDGVLRDNGTLNGIVVKAVRRLRLGWGFLTITGATGSDRAFGYITYWDGTGPSAAQLYNAYTGFQGEKAGDRIVRLAAESGYTASVAGESVFQQPMGVQGAKKLLELLNEASATNFGYLLDRRDAVEIIHRGQSTLWNQPPALTLDYSAGLISPPFKPVDDDKLTENDVTVKREYGAVPSRQVIEDGPLSVLDPENGGVGRYDNAYTYSLNTDAQAAQVAYMRVHLGTYDGVRYTRITLNLANERVYALIDDILRIDVGDKIRLTNLPADHGPDDVDVLVVGYTEEAGPDGWLITFNCVPGEPWNAAVTNSATYGRADTAGCQLAEALDATETGANVFTTAVARWIDSPTYPSEFPFDVRTGGEVMRVTGCTSAIQDAFGRSVSGGWGTADIGGAWTTSGGSSTDYAVGSGVGTHTLSTVNSSRRTFLPAPLADFDLYCDIATSTLATGASLTGAVMARYLDTDNLYTARLEFQTSGAIVLSVRERVSGTETSLGSLTTTLTHVAGTFYRVRFQGTGTALKAKVWTASAPEPGPWHLQVTDSSLTAQGSIGCRSISLTGNTNAGAVIRYENFNLANPQTLTVTRSINGVVKSHASGQDVRLANPVYVAM